MSSPRMQPLALGASALMDVAGAAVQFAFTRAAPHGSSRRALNALYTLLPWSLKGRIYGRCGRVFRREHVRAKPGVWRVKFGRRRILLPLSAEFFPRDWEVALGILGHDPALKRTYDALFASPHAPTLVVDVGANYGTHALLFMARGARVIAFEPNRACHGFFLETCRLNGFEPVLEPYALGSCKGGLELSYPQEETWLGTADTNVKLALSHKFELVSQHCAQQQLDDHIERLRGQSLLIKIDTEGWEHDVLLGASRILSELRPWLIFESNQPSKRAALGDVIASQSYRIFSIPWYPRAQSNALSTEQFLRSGCENFIAIPAEKVQRANGAG